MPHDDVPAMQPSRAVTGDWTVLPSVLPVPGLGGLPANAFLWRGSEPILVDTGLAALGGDVLNALAAEIDLDDLRWIWLSHTDADHIGNLDAILDRAPRAQVVTNFLGMGKMQLAGHDLSRVHLLEPGEVLEAGGRRFVPVRPPYYDAPETMGFFDPADRVLFAADAFGALLPETPDEIDALDEATLRDGLVGWSAIDAPWLGQIDPGALGRTLAAIRRLDPEVILSGHLPVARRGAHRLTGIVGDADGLGATAAAQDALSLDTLIDGLAPVPTH